MNRSRHASVELALGWASGAARHTERRYVEKVNFWRDVFPGDLGERLANAAPGESTVTRLRPGDGVPAHNPGQVVRVMPSRLRRPVVSGRTLEPRPGRFYPRGMLLDVGGIYPQDRHPFRFLGGSPEGLRIDLNHPLARFPLEVTGTVVHELPVSEEHGGRCNDLVEDLTAGGPGLQAGDPEVATDFLSDEPFTREDSREDALFYGQARLVNHIDARAISQVRSLYGRMLTPGMRVLDLMSSWTSHLPEHLQGLEVTGLGMNAEELERNERLAHRVVHDLNRVPELPFEDGAFDAAVCTVSVEYLTRPLEVFAEVARILRPGSPFVLTFSDRWFPPKVVRVWTELHPFERLGLVLEYFRATGAFEDLHTETTRGWPRPADDRYAHTLAHADPVYALWGYRTGAAKPGA